MERFALLAIVVGLGAALVLLMWKTTQAAKARAALRAGYFDAVQPMFSKGLKAVAPTGFPRLSGQVQGVTFDLQAVPDTLTFRKLPALWLLVTLPSALPVRGVFDLMIRPMGVEPFSNFSTLGAQIAVPEGFPADCAIRCDDAAIIPPEALLRRHLRIFNDARVKELVISPKGVRIVWLAEEADRGRYLLFRDAEMGVVPLPPVKLQPLIAALLDLQADILATYTPKESLSA